MKLHSIGTSHPPVCFSKKMFEVAAPVEMHTWMGPLFQTANSALVVSTFPAYQEISAVEGASVEHAVFKNDVVLGNAFYINLKG